MLDEMVLVGYGSRTPIGTRAGITAASVRAGFSGLSLSDTLLDAKWETVRIAWADYLEPELRVLAQLGELAAPALLEALSFIKQVGEIEPEIPVIVMTPSERPGLSPDLAKRLSDHLSVVGKEQDYDLVISPISEGNTSFATGLKIAREKLETNRFCAVGGVDSYITPETIDWLENSLGRLQCSDNKNGFVPGHAAGFCLLTRKSVARELGLQVFATVLAEAEAAEDYPFSSGKLSTGRGLTQAIKSVLESIPEKNKLDQFFANLNGEPYNAQDLAYAALNIGDVASEISGLVAPYNCWGEIGMAAGPILIGLAVESAKRRYAKGPLNMVTLTSLDEARGCILLKLNLDNV